MQNPIGELIRQVRRQHNLTQSELGGNRYSKSYVSAVERNKIHSSQDALRYFAEQLGQQDEYFISLLEQGEQNGHQVAVQYGDQFQETNGQFSQDDTITLLDMLLENTDLSQLSIRRDLPSLSPENIGALPAHKQFRFYYLMGLIAREQGALTSALNAFEYALVLAPTDQQPVILDEIGTYYASTKAYHTALTYFQRGLALLPSDTNGAGRFRLELHSADSYSSLGIYEQAIEYYEMARQRLQSNYGIRIAALLYLGLGYCIHASIQQKVALQSSTHTTTEARVSEEDTERSYQRAVGFLIQSRTVFQVTNDQRGEAQVCLSLAFILLDFSEWRRKTAQEKMKNTGKIASMNCATLLHDAEDQYCQVLLNSQDVYDKTETDLKQYNGIVATACAGLIHCALQRAMLARFEGHAETAGRELAHVSYLCQQTLDIFKAQPDCWNVIRNVTSVKLDDLDYRSPVLPRLLPTPDALDMQWRDLNGLVEVYFALGATCEELGRAATTPSYMSDCYARATSYFQFMLAQARQVVRNGQIDAGYLTRCYARCASLLEERARTSPSFSEEAMITLLAMLKGALALQSSSSLLQW